MVSLEGNVISIGGKTETIKTFAVWFVSPVGLHSTVDEGLDVCRKLNINVLTDLQPVCVAIGTETLYEVMR